MNDRHSYTDGRYINPLTDFGFKKIFGDKEIMQAFLTDLLQPQSPITDITFIDKELPEDMEQIRGVIYDLHCRTADGKEFIVEMQNKRQQFFSDRIVYYLSRSVSSQVRRGKASWEYDLMPVYGIFFLNFHIPGLVPKAVRTVQMQVAETGEVFSETVKAYTLELPEFRNKSVDCATNKIEYWLYNIANMENMTESLPFQQQQPIFNRVGNISELVKMDEEERAKYNISLDTYLSNLAVMKNERREGREEGREEGLKEGREEGLKEGRKEEKISNARNLKAAGVPVDIIATSLGMTVEEVMGI